MSDSGGGDLTAVAVIPARFGSSRLPGKPLLEAAGRPLIEHVWRRVRSAERISDVVVATDDQRIVDAVRAFGGDARLTASTHETGSDRIGELLPDLEGDVIVNVQGDEPEIEPGLLDRLVEQLECRPDIDVGTVACPFPEDAAPDDANLVKLVAASDERALYFSRAPIPGRRVGGDSDGLADYPLLHVGVYAYRRSALERFLSMPRSPLEIIESLEQLRLLENGMSVGLVMSARVPAGVDTPAEFEAFRQRAEGAGRAD